MALVTAAAPATLGKAEPLVTAAAPAFISVLATSALSLLARAGPAPASRWPAPARASLSRVAPVARDVEGDLAVL